MSTYYFAYGSCMDEVDFKRTVPKFQILGPAVLPDYKLVFSKFGQSRQGGVADIVPAVGQEVQGVVYRFAEEFLPDLDDREGVRAGMYERIEMNIRFAGHMHTAYTYRVLDKEEQEVKPTPEYVRLIWNGMQRFATQIHREQFQERLRNDFGIKL